MENNILVTNLIRLFLFAFFMGVMAAIFGQKVYLTNNKYEADHTCYIVNNPYVADWVIYMTHNQYEAEEGRWFITNNKYDADYIIHLTSNMYFADYTIFTTNNKYIYTMLFIMNNIN